VSFASAAADRTLRHSRTPDIWFAHASHHPITHADDLGRSSQVIFFAIFFKITSCFIIRSSSAAEIAGLVSNLKPLQPLFSKRTDTVLIQPDILRANNTTFAGELPVS
jgi:hypothetical protein